MNEEDIISVTAKRDLKPGSKLARRFAELVTSEGKTPKQAANLLHIDLGDPGSYQIANEVQQIIKGYSMKPDVSRAFVQATRRKILVDAMMANEYDLALDAGKQIASEPEVGLNAPPAPLVSLTFGSIEELLDKMDEKDVIIDVTPDKDEDNEQ